MTYFPISTRTTLLALAAAVLLLPSCENGGHFSILGYTTEPNFRCDIHTVRVKVFVNKSYRQGLEFQLTNAVIREIERRTNWKVVNGDRAADTEISGTIMGFTKGTLDVNNVDEVRDTQTILTAQIVWKDLRSGEILSKPPRRPGEALEVPGPTGPIGPARLEPLPGMEPAVITAPTGPTAPVATPATGAITITTQAHFVPELGSSLATSEQQNINEMARQIVNLMEKPW